MSMVRLARRDVAAVNVIAKFVEPRGVSHDRGCRSSPICSGRVGDVNGNCIIRYELKSDEGNGK